jgi:hypothetical protein
MEKDRFGYGTVRQNLSDETFNKVKEGQDIFTSGAFDEWLAEPWDPRRDPLYLKKIVGMVHGTFKGADNSMDDNAEKYINIYRKILTQSSQKDGAPSPHDLHQNLREMQYGKGEE